MRGSLLREAPDSTVEIMEFVGTFSISQITYSASQMHAGVKSFLF